MPFPSEVHPSDSQLSVTSSIEPTKRHKLKIMSPDEATTDLDNNMDSLQDTSSTTKITNDSESSSNTTANGNTRTSENINTFQKQSQKKKKQASPYINVEIVDGTIIHTDNETGFNTVTTAPSFENTSVNNGAQMQSSSKNQFVIWTIRITLQTIRDDTNSTTDSQIDTLEEPSEPYHTENLEQQIFCYKRYSEFVVFRNHLIKKINELFTKTSEQDMLLRKRLQKINVPELPPPVSWWKCFSYNSINFNKNWLKHRQAGLEFFMCSVLLDKDIVEFCNDDVIKKFILTK